MGKGDKKKERRELRREEDKRQAVGRKVAKQCSVRTGQVSDSKKKNKGRLDGILYPSRGLQDERNDPDYPL